MRLVALLASLLTASVSFAQAVAYRAGPGIQMTTGASLPTTIAGRRTLWVDSSNRLRFWNGTDSTYPSTIAATTKGDLSVFTGSEWGRLAAGTNNYCLVADSAEVTGLKWASCSAATGYQTIKDEGSSLTQRTILNFTGAGVTCVDNAGATRTDCTISSGGSTGNWTFTGDAADDTGAAVLTIGATTATGVTLSRTAGTITMAGDTVFGANKGVTVTAGTSSFNFSGGTGTFLTSSGANTLSGTTTLAASKNFVYAAGTGTFDGSASSGAFTTSTGTNTLSGNVVISGAKTFTTGTGQASINGDLQMASGKHIYGGASTSAADFSAGSGIFKTTTGAATFGGSSNTFTNGLTGPSGGLTIGDSGNISTRTAETNAATFTDFAIRGNSHTTNTDRILFKIDGTDNWSNLLGENTSVLFQLSHNVQFQTGAMATQREIYVSHPTYSFVGASVITDAATMAISGPPTAGSNATITNPYALWVESGVTYLAGGAKFAGSLTGTYNIAGTPTATSPILANLGATTVAPTWTAVTYTAGGTPWVDFSGSATSRYTKSAIGIVTLEVRMKTGTNTPAFNMPAGYRPGQVVSACGQTLAGAISCADFTSDGNWAPTVGASTAGVFIRIQYFAEN